MSVEKLIIEPSSTCWPKALNDLEYAPEKIYFKGNPEILDAECLSIIGARKATPYGLAIAEMSGRIAAECGLCVVSGAARGCDYAATRAALNAHGTSIIVSGCGCDVIYPKSSKDIYDDVLRSQGAILSLVPWDMQPTRFSFVKRNAIIAALSPCLLVTEAGFKSGTMSTANHAADMGRSIFAIPGSIFSPSSSGTNALIKNGASIISDERDLELEISMSYGKLRLLSEDVPRSLSGIMSALVACPMRPHELAERMNCSDMEVLSQLAELEIQGLIIRFVDGRYSPSKSFLVSQHSKQVIQ